MATCDTDGDLLNLEASALCRRSFAGNAQAELQRLGHDRPQSTDAQANGHNPGQALPRRDGLNLLCNRLSDGHLMHGKNHDCR